MKVIHLSGGFLHLYGMIFVELSCEKNERRLLNQFLNKNEYSSSAAYRQNISKLDHGKTLACTSN